MVSGYTLILIIDKVIFDPHAVFHSHDNKDGEGADITSGTPKMTDRFV